MLPEHPHVDFQVHPPRLLRERLRHVRAPSEPPSYGLRLVECSVHPVLSLTPIGKVVAVATQEVAPRTVQNRNPPAASRSRTDKPRPLSPEVAGRPAQGHGLPYVFPFSA